MKMKRSLSGLTERFGLKFERRHMRSVFIYFLLISFIHSQAFGVSYLTGDAIRSPDRSKTWLMPDASDTLVGKETEDTLKNKTLENPQIEGALTVEELSAKPTPPPAGQKKIYCKDDGKCYTLDSSDNEKQIGAGAGGGGSDGINFLTNPTFEDGSLEGWTTVSGLDYEVEEDEALGPNVTTICVDWEGSANAVISQIADISPDALGFSNVDGVNLGHKIWVKASFEGLKVEAMHLVGAGPATVANALDIPGDFKWREFDVTSVGSAMLTGVGIRIRPTNSNTGKVCFARARVGPWDGIGSVAQATFVGTLTYPSAPSCDWSVTSSSYTVPSANTNCATPTTTGNIAAPSTKIPGFVIPKVEPGYYYRITASGDFTVHSNNQNIHCKFALVDGSTVLGESSQDSTSTGVNFLRSREITGGFIATQPRTNVAVSIAAARMSAGGSCNIEVNATNNIPDLRFFVEKFPLESEQVVRVGQGADLLGTIIYTEQATCPAGTLHANGGTIPPEYSALIARRGSNTLPDLRGIFIRGAGSQEIGGVAYSATLGEKQGQSLSSHKHILPFGWDHNNQYYMMASAPEHGHVPGYDSVVQSVPVYANPHNPPSTVPTGSARLGLTDGGLQNVTGETRPANIALTPCIIATHTYQPLVKHAVTTPYPGVTTINTVKTVSSNYSLTDKDETVEVDASGGAVTITLPDAAAFKGKKFFVTKTDSSANLVTIATIGGQNIGYGTATSTVIHLQGDTVGLQSNGTRWVWITSNMRVESALIDCDSTPEVTLQIGSWVSSVSQVSTGRCNIAVRSGVFSSTPRCNFSSANAGAPTAYAGQGHSESATSINVAVWHSTSASGIDGLVNVTCEGPR